MISTAIEVQLVGQSALLLILPTVAIVISVFSIGLTLWFRRRDDARIAITSGFSFTFYPGEDQSIHYFVFSATNKGRAGSTVLNSLELSDRKGRGLFYPDGTPLDSTFPISLAPGASARVAMPVDAIADAVEAGIFDLSKARMVARSGHGRTSIAVSKKACSTLSRPRQHS